MSLYEIEKQMHRHNPTMSWRGKYELAFQPERHEKRSSFSLYFQKKQKEEEEEKYRKNVDGMSEHSDHFSVISDGDFDVSRFSSL